MTDDVDEVIAAVEAQIAKAEAFDAIAPQLVGLLEALRPWGRLPGPAQPFCFRLTLMLAKVPDVALPSLAEKADPV